MLRVFRHNFDDFLHSFSPDTTTVTIIPIYVQTDIRITKRKPLMGVDNDDVVKKNNTFQEQ